MAMNWPMFFRAESTFSLTVKADHISWRSVGIRPVKTVLASMMPFGLPGQTRWGCRIDRVSRAASYQELTARVVQCLGYLSDCSMVSM